MEFCDTIDPECNSSVLSLDRALAARSPDWLLEAVPSYGCLALVVDPARSTKEAITNELKEVCASVQAAVPYQGGRLHQLPVRYGGEFGPDLGFVARSAGVAEDEVVKIHTSREYHCYMLGFTPGFVYLGGVDDKIAVPRLETPRLKVAAGSVGLAGNQTGFYGMESPGGWRVIGRLQVATFDVGKEPPSSILPGDRVRFLSVK